MVYNRRRRHITHETPLRPAYRMDTMIPGLVYTTALVRNRSVAVNRRRSAASRQSDNKNEILYVRAADARNGYWPMRAWLYDTHTRCRAAARQLRVVFARKLAATTNNPILMIDPSLSLRPALPCTPRPLRRSSVSARVVRVGNQIATPINRF